MSPSSCSAWFLFASIAGIQFDANQPRLTDGAIVFHSLTEPLPEAPKALTLQCWRNKLCWRFDDDTDHGYIDLSIGADPTTVEGRSLLEAELGRLTETDPNYERKRRVLGALLRAKPP